MVALALASSSVAMGQERLRLHEVDDGAVRVDGMLRDWRGLRRVRVGSGRDASMQVVFGYNARGLYVAASVQDQRMIRTARHGANEDAIVVTFAMPARRGFTSSELWLYAGVAGQSAAAARIGPLGGRTRPVRGAEVVEARTRQGYELEAFIPWAQIPGAARWQRGGRAAVRLRDVDSEARPRVEAEPSFGTVDRQNLDRLPELSPTGGEHAVLARFLESQGIGGARPRHDLSGQVCGDRRPERVVHVERYIVILGPGYREGRGFDYLELPIRSGSDVIAARLQDFTGDRKAELFLRLRQRGERGTRDLWQLFAFDCESVRALWGIEVRKETDAGHVESRVHVRGQGRPSIEVTAGEARGLTPQNFQESPASDAEGILLPWGPVLARTYRWNGRRFDTVRERENPSPYTPETASPSRPAQAQATPPPPSVRDLLAAVRRERRIPRRVRARFGQNANVAGDRQQERVVILGNALVVVGPGFRNGNGYFYYQIQVAAPEDITRLELVDLNRDGRAEVLVYARQAMGEITRTLLMVHRFTRGGEFPRILSAEVGRVMGNQRIENEVRTRGGRLEVRAGRAVGWSESTWPWNDAGGGEGIEPLLLPWQNRVRRYQFRQGRLQ